MIAKRKERKRKEKVRASCMSQILRRWKHWNRPQVPEGYYPK
jgi:hypothetical protein